MKRILLSIIFILGLVLSAAAQNKGRTITGQVLDPDALPVPGAVVMVAGTANGVSTDADGKYSIKAGDDDVLVFNVLGYQEVRERVDKRKIINVVLSVEKTQLEDVVVIAYGTATKSDLTGSVGTVNMSDLEDKPVLSVDQALQGRIAGVDIVNGSGEPGASSSIQIRGSRSITASNKPLIVVDGVVDAVEDFSDINPADIKSVTVLKDASSTAIYGSRGSNGVILVTTQTGTPGTLYISFKGDWGLSELPRKLDIMNASEFAAYRNDVIYFNNGKKQTTPQVSGQLPFENPESYGEGTDWMDVLSRKAFTQGYTLALSRGTTRSKEYFSIRFDDNDGIIKGSDFTRITSRLNLDWDLFKWLKAGLRGNFSTRNANINNARINGGNNSAAVCLSPLLTIEDKWNKYADTGVSGGSVFNNPYIVATNVTNMTKVRYLNLSPYLEFNIVKGLKFKSSYSYTLNTNETFYYAPSTLPVAMDRKTGGTARRTDHVKKNILSENVLTYNRTFNRAHKMDLLAGFTAQNTNVDYKYTQGIGYLDDKVAFYNMGGLEDPRNLTEKSSVSEVQRLSFIARANYSYRSRYFATFTGRYDGASIFSEGNKWAFFPAVAFKWSISNEPFMAMAKANWLSDLSLRISAGRSGNDALSSYVSQAALTSTQAGWLFGDVQGLSYYPTRLDNPDLTWEKTDSYNIGVDFSVLRDRLTFTLELYKSYTKDLLLQVKNAAQTGFTSRFDNVGSTENSGVEFTVNSHNITRKNFEWTTTFTISHNKQMVTDIGIDYEYVPTFTKNDQMLYGYMKGYPVNALWGYQAAGVWHNDQEREENRYTKTYVSYKDQNGYTKYVDVNHDGVLDQSDQRYLGCSDPVVYGGLQNTFEIYGLTLGVYFTYSLGGKIYNLSEFNLGSGSPMTNQYRYMMNSWHPVRNPDSDIPRAYGLDNYASDRYVHDASFLRLRNLSLGYKFDLSRKVKFIRDITVTASCDNVWLWTKYNGFDPEVSSSGAVARLDNEAYPMPRTYYLSVKFRY